MVGLRPAVAVRRDPVEVVFKTREESDVLYQRRQDLDVGIRGVWCGICVVN